MSVRTALTLAAVFLVAVALPASAQMAMGSGGAQMMGGRGGSMPGMGGGMMGGSGGMMGGQTQTYDLAKAKRLMKEAADAIEEGKTQYAAGQYREAKRLFKSAKEKLDEVRGTNQQAGMGGAMGGPGMMGSGGPGMMGSSGPGMMGSGGSLMGSGMMGSSGSPMGAGMMGSSGGPMMGAEGGMMGGGMGGGFSTGLIPPEKDDLVVQARIMWMTAVAWWGKSWGAIARAELVPDRVLLGPWTSGTSQMGGMGGAEGMGPMMGAPGGGPGMAMMGAAK